MKGLTAIPYQFYLIAPIVEVNHRNLKLVHRITTICLGAILLTFIARFSNNDLVIQLALTFMVISIVASICGHLFIRTYKQIGTIELSKKGCTLNVSGSETHFEWSNDSDLKIIYRLGIAGQRNIVNNQLGHTYIEYTEKGVDRKAYFVFTFDDMATAFLNLVSYLNEEHPGLKLLNIIDKNEQKR
jgi:hypothetical protein